MEAFLLNTLLGICMGRFLTVWAMLLFVPLIAAEMACYIYMYDMDLRACVRRCVALIATADLAFLLGALLRPSSGKGWD